MDIQVNYLAILLATVSAMAIGFAWYGPMLFGNPWMKLMGYTKKSMEETKDKMMQLYFLSFVGTLIVAFVLSHVARMSASFFEYPFLTASLSSAFWMWFGFVSPTQLGEVLYGGRPWKVYFINTSYQLVSLLAMGGVIGYFG